MIKLIENTRHILKGTPFQTLPVFISNGSYFLTNLKIYKNGYIDCWELVTLDEFVQKVENGWVTVELDPEDNYDISIFGLGEISPGFHYQAHKTNQDLILEVMDILSELNGQQTSSERCYQAWQNYQKESSQQNIMLLKEAYEAIPHHQRIYVLHDQDLKDRPIRQVIYGEEPFILDSFYKSSLLETPPIQLSQHINNPPINEVRLMNQLQNNLDQVREIKRRYEQEIHQFIQQKLNAFHEEINLPIQYIDVDIDSTNDQGDYQSIVQNCKLHIQVDL